MRDEQLTVGGRPKLVLGVDLKIPSPYKMIKSERGFTNAGNQGAMAPRISREVTFVYIGFCFLQISAQQAVCHMPSRLRQQTTNNFNTNAFKTTCKIILYGQNDKTEMRILAQRCNLQI
jgi:hypothetical protein